LGVGWGRVNIKDIVDRAVLGETTLRAIGLADFVRHVIDTHS
jgi:hypothetical protein